MALKIRVTATDGRGATRLVYRAEAYDETDDFREPKWTCTHDHESVERAIDCGWDWLDRRAQLESA